MKKGIHPKLNKNVEVKHNGKTIMNVLSTSEELNVEIWAGNHPFYTGKETLVDTDDLVKKFNEKVAKSHEKTGTSKKIKRNKRVQRIKETYSKKPVTLKDMINNLN